MASIDKFNEDVGMKELQRWVLGIVGTLLIAVILGGFKFYVEFEGIKKDFSRLEKTILENIFTKKDADLLSQRIEHRISLQEKEQIRNTLRIQDLEKDVDKLKEKR